MTEIANELMEDVLKAFQPRLSDRDDGQRDLRGQIGALRGGQTAIRNRIGAVQHELTDIEETRGAVGPRSARLGRRLQVTDHPAE